MAWAWIAGLSLLGCHGAGAPRSVALAPDAASEPPQIVDVRDAISPPVTVEPRPDAAQVVAPVVADAGVTDVGSVAGACPQGRSLVWRLDFSHPGWNSGAAGVAAALQAAGGALDMVTGTEHVSVVADAEHGNALRVRFPPGSGSQDCVDLKQCSSAGGIVFFLPFPDGGAIKSAFLSYWVKFDPTFQWVRGGKLPGLCGHGCPIAGAKVGPDRFSLRYMWRKAGEGEVYSYLTYPPNSVYGLEMGTGSWTWSTDGAWHHIQEELVLNNGNANDGLVRVWYDKPPTAPPDFEQKNLKYYDRTRFPELGIDTFVFTTFHGGHDRSWSPTVEATAQFADFQLCR